MKKFVIGVIVGAVLMFSGQAFGAISSLTGKKVSSELFVKVNGKSIGKGIVVTNKTYLPVREVANAFDADIGIDEGGLSLTTETTISEPSAEEIEAQRLVDIGILNTKKAEIEEKLRDTKIVIENHEKNLIPRVENSIPLTTSQKAIDRYNQQLSEMHALVAEKKASIPVLEAELADVISKIAELEAQ